MDNETKKILLLIARALQASALAQLNMRVLHASLRESMEWDAARAGKILMDIEEWEKRNA